MATVYLARDLRHDRPVALKVLEPDLAAALGTERFLREIKLVARLQHPHILPILDSGVAAGHVWFTMPAVAGGSLRQRLDREGQLPLPDAVRIATQVASALSRAHQDGIVHRDVKPENILLSGDQSILADFGIARSVDAAGLERLTGTGMSVGTPAYMSPEQAVADPHVDGRSDIYSLGCVLYEMLTGDPPFTGRTAQAVMARRMAEPVPSMRTLRDVPEQLDHVASKALARAPADRFADANSFADALAAAVRDAVPLARPAHGRRRRPAVIAAAAMLATAALTVAAYLRLRPEPSRPADANLLAVAPFDVLDSSLELWREGLGDILVRALDGAGPLRTVPPTVSLRQWEGRADQPSADALGRRTGAGLVVFGAIAAKGRDSVMLRASVLDRTTAEMADLEVAGEEVRMSELADSLGIAILRHLSRSRPIGSVRQVTIGSKSLPALKAFLQGEQFYRRGLWDSALSRYDQAVSADTSFALANRRMGLVVGWHPSTAGAYLPPAEYARRAARWNRGLSPKDSLLITAESFAFDAEEATDPQALTTLNLRWVAASEEATRRFPGDPEAWYTLAETRQHQRPVRPPAAVRLALFERAVALDSGFGPAYEHLPELALEAGQVELARRYATSNARLNPMSNGAVSALLAILLDAGGADSAARARMVDTASVFAIWQVGLYHLTMWPDSSESDIRLLRRIGEPGRAAGTSAPWVVDSLMWRQYLAGALSQRGHLREAYETNRRLLLDPAASPFSWFEDPFVDLSLLGIVPDSVTRATFARGLEPKASWGSELMTPRHLRGLPWWLQRRDTLSLARFAARAAEVSGRPSTLWVTLRSQLLGSMAEAYLSLARGDSTDALRRLQAIPDALCIADDYAPNCFHLRLTQARLLAARGEHRQAADLIEVWRLDNVVASPSFVLAMLERARLAEVLGEREKAIESYGFVSACWRKADPELQGFVEEAREALVRLGGR